MQIEGSKKSIIKKYYRAEFMGAGFYGQLAKSSPDYKISTKVNKVAEDEYRHGVMFSRFYSKHYGGKSIPSLWLFLGKVAACMIFFIPFKLKIKVLSSIEEKATKQVAEALSRDIDADIAKLLKAITPDELRHAKLYESIYK